MRSLSVLVPIFNEEPTIAQLVSQLCELPFGTIKKCIFIDDGSTDRSVEFLTQALSQSGLPYLILEKQNAGKASAIKDGAKHLTTSHVVILDSDLELVTADITRLWEIVQRGESDFVFGYRKFLAQSSFTWRFSRGNQVISNLYGLFFNEVVSDIMCGYKLVPSSFLAELPFKYRKFGLEIEIPMYMWMNSLRPYEIEVEYRARTRSEGKSISWKDAIHVIASMVFFRITHKRIQS